MMRQVPGFDPIVFAKRLLRESRSGALATLFPASGDPYCSLVNVASAADGAPVLLLSQLALHTKNLQGDARASLLLDERKEGDPLEGARIMLMGAMAPSPEPQIRRRYLARHPDAAMFADFGDFGFYRMELRGAHLVAGFGRIVDLAPAQMLSDLAESEDLVTAEDAICEHMNSDHGDTLDLYAETLLGGSGSGWRCVGCDPEGLELQRGRIARRLPFPEPVRSPGVLRQVLKRMADQARLSRDAPSA